MCDVRLGDDAFCLHLHKITQAHPMYEFHRELLFLCISRQTGALPDYCIPAPHDVRLACPVRPEPRLKDRRHWRSVAGWTPEMSNPLLISYKIGCLEFREASWRPPSCFSASSVELALRTSSLSPHHGHHFSVTSILRALHPQHLWPRLTLSSFPAAGCRWTTCLTKTPGSPSRWKQ